MRELHCAHVLPGSYRVEAVAFGQKNRSAVVDVPDKRHATVDLPIGFSLTLRPVGGV